SGTGALGYIANHFRMPSLRPLQEYRHASWPVDAPFVFLGTLLLARLAFPRPPWRHLLPALALGVLGALRIRFVAEHALCAGPVAAATLSVRGRGPLGGARVGLALAALPVVPRAVAARRGGRWLDVGLEADLVPTAAIRFAEEHGLRDRMYND